MGYSYKKIVGVFLENEEDFRRNIIDMEIIVDSYDDREVKGAWECYLEEVIVFPFKAKLINNTECPEISKGEIVTVTDMDSDVYLLPCTGAIEYVFIEWKDMEEIIAPKNLENLEKDNETLEAIKNWNFWVNEYFK